MTKWHFIHIPKNAGMTIRRSPTLAGKFTVSSPKYHISPDYTANVKRTMDQYGDHHGFEHARLRDIRADHIQSHTPFAIIRNPWSRTVSRYWFAYKVIHVERKVPAEYCDVSSFESFLDERHKWGELPYMWHRAVRGWYNQVEYITAGENHNRDAICLRFEHLQADLSQLFGVDFQDRSRNVTAVFDKPYHEMYNDRTIQIVADWYAKDIEHFGFDFDRPAQRNTHFRAD